MNVHISWIVFLFFLTGCATTEDDLVTKSTPVTHQGKSWHPSTLSEQTKEIALTASRDYFGCIDRELNQYHYQGGDSRYETQALLRLCEKRLDPIRTAFASEGVPSRITNRYMKRKRTQAARHVLRVILSMEAQHKAANAAE